MLKTIIKFTVGLPVLILYTIFIMIDTFCSLIVLIIFSVFDTKKEFSKLLTEFVHLLDDYANRLFEKN